MSSAIVVGSGPNGLAAAARLARAGLDVTVLEAGDTIGGGTRSSEMIVPGLVHDHRSAIHPIAAASPFLTGLDLASEGLTWLQPAVDCAHPLDDGSAGVLYRSIERTVDEMGRDGQRCRSYRQFRHGPAAFKVDFAVAEGVPWTAPAARQAGTVHLGGDFDEVVANEEAVHRGEMPERPFVLVGQQYLADPTRSVGNIHPVWTYAHVPHAYSGDGCGELRRDGFSR